MQISRLFKIIYILLDRKNITAKELSEKLEVSVRTIYRDIDALSLAGIPIYTTKGKGGGIGILDNFILNKSLLSEKDQNEILIGLQSLKITKHLEVDDVSSKLSSLFKKDNLNWIEVDFSSFGNNDHREKFNILKDAIVTCRVISFEYYSSYGVKTTREIEPLKLCFKDKAWYLQGYCLSRNDYRTFKITRMSRINLTDESFNRSVPSDLSIETLENKVEDLIYLKLLFSPYVSYRVYDEFSKESIEKNSNGTLTVSVEYPKGPWVYGFILSYGSFVEVLQPKSVREYIKKELQKTIEKY